MYKVGIYFRVRKACSVDGMSVREAARMFGLHRDTVRKMLEYSVPPGYRRQRPPRRPKLDPFKGVIDRILEQDLTSPKKQRHTAKRIYERLRDEHGYPGKYTIVKDYVRECNRHTREMFVPLSHAPGHAQCDYGEALVIIAGVKRKAHYFALDLPHSDGCYVKAYPAETTESFCDGHVSAASTSGTGVDSGAPTPQAPISTASSTHPSTSTVVYLMSVSMSIPRRAVSPRSFGNVSNPRTPLRTLKPGLNRS